MTLKFAVPSIILVAVLTACNHHSSSGSSTASTGFPAGVSVASPLASGSSSSVARLDGWQQMRWPEKTQLAWRLLRQGEWRALAHAMPNDMFIADTYAAAGDPSEHEAFVTLLDDILSGDVALATALNSAYLFESDGGNANCYGPTMNYVDHPQAGTPNSGQLPSGDLGIWAETVTSDTTACAAEQLNLKMRGAKRRIHTSLLILAGMRRVAFANSLTPAAGASANLLTPMNALGLSGISFTTATLARSTDGGTWTYTLALDVTVTTPIAGTFPVTLSLSNTETSTGVYSGTLQFTAEGTNDAGNCQGVSPKPVTAASTVKYERSSTEMTISQRIGNFCGVASNLPSDVYDADNELNPAAKYSLGTGKGWADNFSRFAASFDPATLDGNFAFAWQAGYLDGNTRMFNVWTDTVSGVRVGEAYFGFGDDIETSDGSIKGMICNWAGPGSSHSYSAYAQRQSLTFDATASKWLVGASSSDIRYAPTTTCEYTNATHGGGATFWYDRNLTGANSGLSTQANLIADATDVTFPLDLMGQGASATITAAITARGFTLPSNF
ncbi:MAG: hypothetical protein HY308_13160 [Gammaproteobacteria bacterium]|nr:hypothetical protein [Gammaproteobacteria bacterium]